MADARGIKDKVKDKVASVNAHVTKDFESVKKYTSFILVICLVLIVDDLWVMVRALGYSDKYAMVIEVFYAVEAVLIVLLLLNYKCEKVALFEKLWKALLGMEAALVVMMFLKVFKADFDLTGYIYHGIFILCLWWMHKAICMMKDDAKKDNESDGLLNNENL